MILGTWALISFTTKFLNHHHTGPVYVRPVFQETTLPNISMKVAYEPLDASKTRMTKEKDVKVHITKTAHL